MKKIKPLHAKQIHDKFEDLKNRKHEILNSVKIPSISNIRNSMFNDNGVWTMHLKNNDPFDMNELRLVAEQVDNNLISFGIIPTVNWNFDPILCKDLEEITKSTALDVFKQINML